MGKKEYLHKPDKGVLSLKLVSILNYLNYPFYLLGFLFLFWIGVEYFLKLYLPPVTLEK